MVKKYLSLLSLTLFFTLLLWGVGFCIFLVCLTNSPFTHAQKTDGIVVLTGSKGRVQQAANLLDKGFGDHLLITGIYKDTTPKALAYKQNIPENILGTSNDIVFDYNAKNTFENAKETQKWVKEKQIKSLRLVTANYHIPRAYLEFSSLLKSVDLIPHPVNEIGFSYLKNIKVLSKEYLKFSLIILRMIFRNFL